MSEAFDDYRNLVADRDQLLEHNAELRARVIADLRAALAKREAVEVAVPIRQMMARLTELLDEDQFAEIERIALGAGVQPPSAQADVPVQDDVSKDASLSGKEFDALLILLMCSDPWPVGDEENEKTVKAMATRIAKLHGHDDWVDAYHSHAPTDAAKESKNGDL